MEYDPSKRIGEFSAREKLKRGVGKIDIKNENTKKSVAEWFKNPESWDYSAFCEDTKCMMKNNLHNYHPMDDVLIGMLADSMSLYIECSKNTHDDLLVYQDNGEIIGRSPLIKIQVDMSKQIVNILKELEILPLKVQKKKS